MWLVRSGKARSWLIQMPALIETLYGLHRSAHSFQTMFCIFIARNAINAGFFNNCFYSE
jgi:hypothetical protein